MKTHEEILNEMLNTMCPTNREGNVSTFRIEGHCCTAYIIKAEALFLSGGKWQIRSFAIENI